MDDWRNVLEQVTRRPAVIPGEGRKLRVALMMEGELARVEVDLALANAWRTVQPVVAQQTVRDALEGMTLGPQLLSALADSAAGTQHLAANAAIALLTEADLSHLTVAQWRAIAGNAAAQRDQLLPDVEAAELLAAHGPLQSLATVALCAFRAGPEDADDRHAAIAGLGRHDDARVIPWLASVAPTGAFGSAIIQAAAALLNLRGGALSSGERAQLGDAMLAACGDQSLAPHVITDGWIRWGALDVLSHLAPERAVGLAIAVWRAAGDTSLPWLASAAAQRVVELGGPDVRSIDSATVDSWTGARGVTVPMLAPIGPPAVRLHARSPRISRRAAVLLEEAGVPDDELTRLLQERAQVEQALVARQQLMGSFLATPKTEPAQLGEQWAPTSELLSLTARAQLEDEERQWLQPSP